MKAFIIQCRNPERIFSPNKLCVETVSGTTNVHEWWLYKNQRSIGARSTVIVDKSCSEMGIPSLHTSGNLDVICLGGLDGRIHGSKARLGWYHALLNHEQNLDNRNDA